MRRAFFAIALVAACAHAGAGSRSNDDGSLSGSGGTATATTAASGLNCAAGEHTCGGKCVDLQTNPAHCGMCDMPCGANEDCVKGQCLPPTLDGATTGSGGASASASSTNASASAQASAQSSSQSASSAKASAVASSSAIVASSSSSGGGTCDPMFPSAVCGKGKHCLPSQNGMTTCKGPTGNGGQYTTCKNDDTCLPADECVATPYNTVYCMDWCQNDLDCSGFDTCYYFKPPVYAGNIQYGACWDGFP